MLSWLLSTLGLLILIVLGFWAVGLGFRLIFGAWRVPAKQRKNVAVGALVLAGLVTVVNMFHRKQVARVNHL